MAMIEFRSNSLGSSKRQPVALTSIVVVFSKKVRRGHPPSHRQREAGFAVRLVIEMFGGKTASGVVRHVAGMF
jgi:hypothetical protein